MPRAEPPDHNDELPVAAPNSGNVSPFVVGAVPQPINASPPLMARILGLAGVILGGLLGGLIGYGVTELLTGGNSVAAAVGFLVGAAACAVGVGIIVSLALRAMNEWNAVHHPLAEDGPEPPNGDR